MKFTKEILKPGIYQKGEETFRVRDTDLQQMVNNFNRMKSMSYSPPVPIEHAGGGDPEGFPAHKSQMSDRDRAKYNAGWVSDLRIENGTLVGDLDIKKKDVQSQIKEVGFGVSPQFGKWKWPGVSDLQDNVITHIALTPYPVESHQNREFTEVSEPIEVAQLSQLVSFSMADMVPEKKKSPFSGGSGGSNSDRGDSDKNNNGVVDGQKPGKPGSAVGDSGDTDSDNDGDNDSGGVGGTADDAVSGQLPGDSGGSWPQIGAALKLLGVILPEGVHPVNSPEALLAALMTCAHHTQKAEATAATQTQPDPMQQVQGQMPGQTGYADPRLQGAKQENMFTMSQTNPEGQKKTDTTVTTTTAAPAVPDLKTLPEFISMSQTNAALSAEVATLKREKYLARIDGLVKSGRITKDKADAFRVTVGTYQFSANGSPTDIVKLDANLELLEEMPEGAVWSPAERMKQMSMKEEENGDFFKEGDNGAGGLTEEQLEKELEALYPTK